MGGSPSLSPNTKYSPLDKDDEKVEKPISYLLTGLPILHTFIIAIKEFSIEQLDRDDSKDEMKEKIDNENVEHIFEGVDHTVKHRLQLGDSLDRLERSQYSQHSQ